MYLLKNSPSSRYVWFISEVVPRPLGKEENVKERKEGRDEKDRRKEGRERCPPALSWTLGLVLRTLNVL